MSPRRRQEAASDSLLQQAPALDGGVSRSLGGGVAQGAAVSVLEVALAGAQQELARTKVELAACEEQLAETQHALQQLTERTAHVAAAHHEQLLQLQQALHEQAARVVVQCAITSAQDVAHTHALAAQRHAQSTALCEQLSTLNSELCGVCETEVPACISDLRALQAWAASSDAQAAARELEVRGLGRHVSGMRAANDELVAGIRAAQEQLSARCSVYLRY